MLLLEHEMNDDAQTVDLAALERRRRRALRTALTTMRRLWTGALLPYVTYLEKSGDPQKYLKAQARRLAFERVLATLEDLKEGREPR